MVGVVVFPIGRDDQLWAASLDHVCNLSPILYRINDSAVRQAEVFTEPRTDPGCSICALIALLARARDPFPLE